MAGAPPDGLYPGARRGPPHDPAGLDVSQLGLDAVLTELLDRSISLLDADTAVVLLIDASGTDLVAHAARGIEEEVHQGVRIRLGAGFAGRIASERRPAILNRVDETTVVNPLLWQRGVRALVGVPLVAGDTTIGVLHVGSTRHRRFTDADAVALAALAEPIAAAVQVRLFVADRDATEVVQRSLLPSAPTSVGPFDCAARYVPARRHGRVGGDWYDAFALDTGEIWIIVGDVAGHGLRAAIAMGRIRSAMRAFALIGEGPREVLALTDRKMTHFEIGGLATVAVMRSTPPYDSAEVAMAGHPPMIRAIPGDVAALIDAESGPPLGVDLGTRPEARLVALPSGSVVAGYTDGLVERRGEVVDVGIERVRSAVTATSPSKVCERVMTAAIGELIPEDDVALIVIQRR